jgi:hypothetical protein
VTVASKKHVAIQAMYAKASGSACQGRHEEARQLYAVLEGALAGVGGDARLRAFVRNDLAVMAAIEGRFDEALTGWKAALEIDSGCLVARLNRVSVEAELCLGQPTGDRTS